MLNSLLISKLLAYRYFFKPKPKAKIVQVMPTQQTTIPQQQTQYVPVQQVVPQATQQVVQPVAQATT